MTSTVCDSLMDRKNAKKRLSGSISGLTSLDLHSQQELILPTDERQLLLTASERTLIGFHQRRT